MSEFENVFKSHDRVAADVQQGGPGFPQRYFPCSGVSGPTEPRGDLTPIYCADPNTTDGRIVVAKTRSIPGLITFDMSTRYRLGKWLEELDCPFNLYVRHFCEPPKYDETNYDQIKVLCDVDKSQQSFSDLIALDTADNVIDVTGAMNAVATFYILHMRVERFLAGFADLNVALNDVFYCDAPFCASDCAPGGRSDGCQKWFAVGDDRGPGYAYGANPILLMYDGTRYGVNYQVREITGLVGDAMFGFCIGNRVFAFDNDGNYAWIADPWDPASEWNIVAGTFPGANYPTAAYVLGRQVWLAGTNGYIWYSDDGAMTFEQQQGNVSAITGGDLLSIDGVDERHIVAVGEGGWYALTNNGGATWGLAHIGADVDLNVVKVPRDWHIYVGANDGLIYYTHDWGETWLTQNLGLGTGVVVDLDFCGGCAKGEVGFALFQTTRGGPLIARTINGGATWTENLDMPANLAHLNALACCEANQFTAVGELGGVTYPYAAVVQGVRAY